MKNKGEKKMKNICFIGAPGCGKTTQVNLLKNYLINISTYIAKATHIINIHDEARPYLKNEEIELLESLKEQTKQKRKTGKLADLIYDEILFETTKRIPNENLVLYEGGPRGLKIAELFLTQKHLVDETIIFHFSFPENEYEHSISRQVFRALKKHDFEFVKSEFERFKQKYEVYKDDTLLGLELLKKENIPVYTINPHKNVNEIFNTIKMILTPYIKQKGGRKIETVNQ